MKSIKKILSAGLGLVIASSIATIVGLSGNASAIACYQYDPSGNFTTSTTPVFDNICGITSTLSSNQGSYPLGDEPNFVRIRQNTSNGNPLGSANPELQNSMTTNCSAGEKFDIWTYIHNDAMSQYNDNGNGSAVAKNVKLATNAPVNTTGNNFKFTSTISADNATTVSDSTTLTCNGQPVKLSLVAQSVHYNNNLSQTTYGSLGDNVVNGSTPVGSPGPMSSGIEWGCWDYRVVVVYEVTVTPVVTPPQVTATCNLLTVDAIADRKATISGLGYTAENASFSSAAINWGDNSSITTITNPDQIKGTSHTYSSYGTYQISALVTFTVPGQANITSGGPGTTCAKVVTYTQNQPPTVTPVTPAAPAPTELVNTGPGSALGIFAAATAVGTIAYRKLMSRRLSQH